MLPLVQQQEQRLFRGGRERPLHHGKPCRQEWQYRPSWSQQHQLRGLCGQGQSQIPRWSEVRNPCHDDGCPFKRDASHIEHTPKDSLLSFQLAVQSLLKVHWESFKEHSAETGVWSSMNVPHLSYQSPSDYLIRTNASSLNWNGGVTSGLEFLCSVAADLPSGE